MTRITVAVFGAALLLAACGGDSDDESTLTASEFETIAEDAAELADRLLFTNDDWNELFDWCLEHRTSTGTDCNLIADTTTEIVAVTSAMPTEPDRLQKWFDQPGVVEDGKHCVIRWMKNAILRPSLFTGDGATAAVQECIPFR